MKTLLTILVCLIRLEALVAGQSETNANTSVVGKLVERLRRLVVRLLMR